MEVNELKNYGKSYVDLSLSLSKKTKKEINNLSFKVMREELGLLKTFRLLISGFLQSKRMEKVNLDPIRDTGFSNDILIKEQVRNAAMYFVLSKMVGKDRSLEVFYRVVDATIPIYYQSFLPEPEDILMFDNPWETLIKYLNAMIEANQKEGVHYIQIIENTENAFQFNCTYCVYYEISKLLGVEEACLPACYGDEVALPPILDRLGIEFKRTTTLARGGEFCDFKFKRKS